MMKIKISSTHRPCLVTSPNRTKTLIVGGTITHVMDEEWNHAYCAIEPADAITLDDIEWEYAGAATVQEYQEWFIAGSKGDLYSVKKCGSKWTCSCPAYTYGKGKWCKHMHKVYDNMPIDNQQ